MESFDHAWHTAADALRHDYRSSEQQWTQHGEEPIAGIQGRGTATDPYDAGNRLDQPGAPQTQENTALVPEALSSITPADHSSSLKSSNSKAASGPAAMQPELNPIGETAAKYDSQPHRVPEQRSLGSNLDRHSQPSGLTHGHSDKTTGLNQGSLAGAGAGATAATAAFGAGSGHKISTGGLGDATAAQTSALPSDSHQHGLRHTGTLGGATSAQTSALGADTTHPTGLRHPSTQKSGLDRGVETSGLGHTTSSTGQTSPMKSALEKDAQETGLRQPASTTHKPVFEKDTHTSSGLEGPRNLGPTTSYGGSETQIPDRSSQAIGTGIEARQPSSGITKEPTSTEARHPSTGTAESAPQKSKSITEQRTSSTTAEGQGSTQKESMSKPTKKGDDVEQVGFTPKTDHVSKEALRGPSVAEPREHWKQDEKVARAEDDGKPAAAAGEPGGSNKHESSDKKHSKDSSHSGGTMAHIKEKVEKVIHPHKS
ncbi:solid-state culture expressed protein (Aos23) [Aspergillus nomiae NRRL 13137]|uniref:Solid-state culture expressed protein (Aos23) n=1 Tax=Aspergillus nomiae NRRL (strain ATCC 15546 / NRRL 13137 / CBS 260.88 / M93) TaxID=1509407 RepID=A0A0L1J1G0_ASPN3|nr:solid-state culture expressed protein (Aos23) [Aspergillus nomiae NRRL 13137]KNG85263.1 solid-state culture expressed protein (Aos23) [Aspergillus nomiae NRRL 13137]